MRFPAYQQATDVHRAKLINLFLLLQFNGTGCFLDLESVLVKKEISIYVINMGILKCHNVFGGIFTFIKFVWDQNGSIFIPNVVRDENTSFLIENKLDKSKNHKKNIMTRKIPILITYIILFNWKPAKCKRKNSQFLRKSINTGGKQEIRQYCFLLRPVNMH